MRSILVILLFQASLILNVSATESIGRVVKLYGEIERVKFGGESKVLDKGDFLYVGDVIQSHKKSFAKILMKDDTVFQIGPKSKFIIEEFKMKTKADRKATYKLKYGKLRSLFTVKAPKRSLTIKTPLASMGIRGTEILTDVYKYKGRIKTDIALISGKLELMTKKRNFFLKTGYVAEFAKGHKNKMRTKTKKMASDVFKAVKRANKRGGHIFLHDARKKLKKINVKHFKFEQVKTNKNKEKQKVNAPREFSRKAKESAVKEAKFAAKKAVQDGAHKRAEMARHVAADKAKMLAEKIKEDLAQAEKKRLELIRLNMEAAKKQAEEEARKLAEEEAKRLADQASKPPPPPPSTVQ